MREETSQEREERERHDKAMLCFYEGEDEMEDAGEQPVFPEPVPVLAAPPVPPVSVPLVSVPLTPPAAPPPLPPPFHKPGGMDLCLVHPVTAVHELCRRMGRGPPVWEEQLTPAGWSFQVTVGGATYSMEGARRSKKEAQKVVSAHCLRQLGIVSRYGL